MIYQENYWLKMKLPICYLTLDYPITWKLNPVIVPIILTCHQIQAGIIVRSLFKKECFPNYFLVCFGRIHEFQRNYMVKNNLYLLLLVLWLLGLIFNCTFFTEPSAFSITILMYNGLGGGGGDDRECNKCEKSSCINFQI